jgi:CRP-like cAMP-binding protein
VTSTEKLTAIDPKYFDEVEVSPGELIASEGALCHQLIVVVDGRLEARTGGRAHTLLAGDSFGWSAMERRGLNEASVVAVTGARLLVMSHAQFRAADALAPRRRFARWALPSSRRSLPQPANQVSSVEAKKAGANPAC